MAGQGGRVAGKRHLGQEHSPFDIDWGHGSSPVLHDGLIVLLCDHSRASYLLALDAHTGQERWKVDRGRGLASYSTPLIRADSARRGAGHQFR